ncbi:MAG TPA: peptidylprolyl isomerase [Pyrinomonadaceae bacterium]|nr:peptidylprolyl isomerase [Pyrinomonadaceae bacterium]
MKNAILALAVAMVFVAYADAQVPLPTGIQILKAEDARRYDTVLENLIRSPNAAIRERAALAAGRIGDERAIPALSALLEKDPSNSVRAMAAFAIGEVESIKGADAILAAINMETKGPWNMAVLARLVEAGGKIAAANPKEEKFKLLGKRVVDILKGQAISPSPSDSTVVRLGLTALLRAKPDGADAVVAKFLVETDARLRADAGNTLTRLRVKNANDQLRKLLASDLDAGARANAARALGAAEDMDAFDLLIKAATSDADSRVRVSAIRALGSLKDAKAATPLIENGRMLLAAMTADKRSRNPSQKSELLEIATVLGRLLPNTENSAAVTFMNELRFNDSFRSSETEIALATVAPKAYVAARTFDMLGYVDWRVSSSYAQGLAVVAASKDDTVRADAIEKLTTYIYGMAKGVKPANRAQMTKAMPDLTQALAAFKPDNLDEVLRGQLTNDDVIIRTTAAGVLADRPKTNENLAALRTAFSHAFVIDKHDNDAELAILDALYKLDKKEAVGSLLIALNSPDYLVRKKAFELLDDKDLQKDFPGISTSLESARAKHKDQVLPYTPAFNTKLGQILNTDADYRRALSRKNGSIRAILNTDKGSFTIEFTPEEAPLTVDNFIKLARSGYFNGLEVHRVVPNFVMQDGDPRGDGNGGPGWSIRCEVNMLPYDRGAVGMALSGKDTGGSQWFVTHSPQPHLDGGYTVFGHVNEKDMKVVDSIVRGDRILSVKIIGR